MKTGTQWSDTTVEPIKTTFISPAFEHANTKNMFGSVNKDGKVRVLYPYQVQTLDMYIDMDNINQEILKSQSSHTGGDDITKVPIDGNIEDTISK